jgi:hypothetical protein
VLKKILAEDKIHYKKKIKGVISKEKFNKG